MPTPRSFATLANVIKLGMGTLILVVGCAAARQPDKVPDTPVGTASHSANEAPRTSPAPQPSSGPAAEICKGSIDEAVQRELSARAARVRSCYEHLLERDPKRGGRLRVTVRISATGAVERAAITLDELNDTEMSKCALVPFRESLQNPISGNCAEVNIPLRFVAKKSEPQDDASNPGPR